MSKHPSSQHRVHNPVLAGSHPLVRRWGTAFFTHHERSPHLHHGSSVREGCNHTSTWMQHARSATRAYTALLGSLTVDNAAAGNDGDVEGICHKWNQRGQAHPTCLRQERSAWPGAFVRLPSTTLKKANGRCARDQGTWATTALTPASWRAFPSSTLVAVPITTTWFFLSFCMTLGPGTP